MNFKKNGLLRALALIICLSLCLSGQAAYALGDGDLDPVDLTEEPEYAETDQTPYSPEAPIEEAEPDFDTIDVSREDVDFEEALPLAEDEWLLDESAELDAVAEPLAGESFLPITMWVEPSDSNGLTERVSLKVISSSTSSWGTPTTTYTCQLLLPFSASVSDCRFSWDGGLSASYQYNNRNRSHSSGNCYIPSVNGSSITYTFSGSGKNVKFTVNTYYALWVEASADNGIPVAAEGEPSVRIDGFGTSAGNYQLYLPGNAVLENCFLSWGDDSVTATISDRTGTFSSGACPIPSANGSLTYTFKKGSTTLASNVMIESYKGSSNVMPIFIVIDENQGTIAAMDGDDDHETSCSGKILIDGQRYDMPKIKGRGNYTWKKRLDKCAYNISLGSEYEPFGTDKLSILAEIGDHSLLCNRTGLHLAEQMGIGLKTKSADVWMNGEYQGCYTVTPKYDSYVTKTGYLLENDNYKETVSVADGGDPQFELDGLFGVKKLSESSSNSDWNVITVKKVGKTLQNEYGGNIQLVANDIQVWMQDAWDAIRNVSDNPATDGINAKGKHYTEYIDIESFAKMYLMHEYVKSYDLCAGSIMFHRDGTSDTDKLIAGPLWDLDNAMGSTQQNSNLGSADNRNTINDRRSGAGDFIPAYDKEKTTANGSGYKTSIFKTLSKHADFMEEVYYQYFKYHTEFENLPNVLGGENGMISDITDSAMMNHNKVQDVTGYNNHNYSSSTTLGGTDYRQEFEATTNSKTDWPQYAGNVLKYVTARSAWFQDHYYFDKYDPDKCEHEYALIEEQDATCSHAGYQVYRCSKCRDSYREDYPKLAHNYQDGVCTMCGQLLRTATIVCDEGATVTVYETKGFTGPCVENATSAHPRDGDTGMIDCGGEGQINFVVNLKPGYHVTKVTVEGEYKNLKGPADTKIENGYRITKVTGDLTITVETDIPKFKTNTLLLSGQIGVRFYMDLSGLTEEERAASYMTFEISHGSITNRADFNPEINYSDADGMYYGFTGYVNVNQMADIITATYHFRSETIQKTYSIKQYIETFMEKQDQYTEKAAVLVRALADYGHHAQIFLAEVRGWNLGTDHEVMDTYFTETYDEDTINSVKSGVQSFAIERVYSQDIESITHSLLLDSETAIKVYFKPAAGYNGSFSAQVDDRSVEYTRSGGQYVVTIPKIAAHKLGTQYVVKAVTENGTATAKVSGMSYVDALLNSDAYQNNQHAKNAVASLYNYYTAADNYNNG